jgi:hypothetical protein
MVLVSSSNAARLSAVSGARASRRSSRSTPFFPPRAQLRGDERPGFEHLVLCDWRIRRARPVVIKKRGGGGFAQRVAQGLLET